MTWTFRPGPWYRVWAPPMLHLAWWGTVFALPVLLLPESERSPDVE